MPDTKLTADAILNALSIKGTYTKMADEPGYLVRHSADRVEAFKKADVPDPAVVRAWWLNLEQLPKSQDNYGKWLDLNILHWVGVKQEVYFTGSIVTEMERLEDNIRNQLGLKLATPETAAPPPSLSKTTEAPGALLKTKP